METINKNEPIKAYNITIIDDDTVDINMYGEVVSQHPVDWWTGEKIPGNFIALDDFLSDIEEIKTKSNINIHINSVGGDFYAGLAIYNRLKSLNSNITTINDGLAASAASIIFQAGKTRKMNSGSNLMIHGVSGFLYDYYNIEQLRTIIKQFSAHNNAAIGVYSERSGKTKEECKSLMNGETWLTGQEAVDAGLADEIIENKDITLSLSADRHFLISNGIKFSVNKIGGFIPHNIPVIKSNLPVNMQDNSNIKNINKKIGGSKEMEIKTVEELKMNFPELVLQIENNSIEKGAKQERERLQAIESIENAITNKDVVKNAKYGENPLTAEQLALVAMKEEAKIRANILSDLGNDGKDTNDVVALGNCGNEMNEKNNDDEKLFNEAMAVVQKVMGGAKNDK